MEFETKKSIDKILKAIILEINESPKYIGLYGGLTGKLLFIYNYLNITEHNDAYLTISNELSEMPFIEHSEKTFSYASGKSGAIWFYLSLVKNNIIDADDLMILKKDINFLVDISLVEFARNNYDFLHGSIGIAYAELYRSEPDSQLSEVVMALNELKIRDGGMFKNFDFETYTAIQNEVNLGLAHGIPSILKFCIACFKKNISKTISEKIANEIITYLLAHANTEKKGSYYGYIIKDDIIDNTRSRLAWCYGDLGIGYILYQAGITFNDQKVIDFALEVLYHSTHRRTVEETQVFDAGICHGSAGVAHIYNRMWHYTKDPVFKEATDFWIQKTLDFAVHEDGVAGYKKYNPTTKAYENDYGLLEGAAGIGLVLLSYITGDFSWDYCLMLND
jgi:lantibiotic modifying enzyme